jgi:hypothetical protein
VLASALGARELNESSQVKDRSLTALSAAVELLDHMRRQIQPASAGRWSLATRAHHGPARDLYRRLRTDRLIDDAERLAETWMLRDVRYAATA